MSEPLSSHEIEDVLSSIRRLVSEELRPQAPQTNVPPLRLADPLLGAGAGAGAGAAVGAAPVADPADAFLLTPALRVVEKTAPIAPPSSDYEDEDWGALAAPELTRLKPQEPVVQTLAESEAAEGLIWAAPGQEEEDGEAIRFDAPPAFVTLQAEAAPRAAEPLAAPDQPQNEWEVSALLAKASEAWRDEEGEDWPDETPASFVSQRKLAADLALVNTAEGGAGASALSQVLADRAEAEVIARLAADEAMAEPAPVQAQPEAAEATETVGEASDDILAKPEAARTEAVAEDDLPVFTLDEALLRDLVREIIREELAGHLGERITRNVRKLVRSEVNRAMTARAFD